ncbi:MAG: ABC transporter ATP-binding protein [Candidatus Saccharimonas sp.]
MSTNKQTIKLYWRQVSKYKTSFFTMLVAIPASVLLFDTFLTYYFSLAIGSISSGDTMAIKANLISAAVVGLVAVVLNVVGFQTMARHEAKVRQSLSEDTFSSVINKDRNFFVNRQVGALTSRYIDFIRSETGLQDLIVIRTLGFVISVSVGLFIVANRSLLLAGVLLILMITLIIEVKWSIKKRKPLRMERKELIGQIHGLIADAVTNNLIVKTFASESNEIKNLSKKNHRFQEVYVKDIGFIGLEGSGRLLIMTVVQIAAISLCAYLAINGRMDVATAIFILAYLQRISSQIFSLGEMINGYDKLLLEAAPMSEMIMADDSVVDAPKAKKLTFETPEIKFDNVSYHYSDSRTNVLENINLTIPAGQKVGLVGHSGAGKTTITQLLLRFADTTDGSIALGGHDIRAVTQSSLRQAIAYVPQDPALFHRSLRENITYGKPHATEAEIQLAAKQANALEFIERMPEGLETIVGERGVKLSGGQRQRIAIARAILKDAPILILDEATSALDSDSERLIQSSLKSLMEGRTSIVVAHRLSTIAKLDRIIVLSDGKIIEDGTHSQLLENPKIYAKLWGHQTGGLI